MQKMQATGYEYKLEPYHGRRTRHTCPGCNKPHQFTLYVDEAGQPIAPHVGKCNRLEKCGYHYGPGQFFRDHPEAREKPGAWKDSDLWRTAYQPPEEKPPAYLPRAAMELSLTRYGQNNFVRYLARLFGKEKALILARRFHLGTSKRWKEEAGGYSVIFWQADRAGNIRQGKAMAYNPETGRRLKEEGKSFVAFLGKAIAGKDANLAQCFFGEHQLPLCPSAPVAIVESEKTAVIMAGIMPNVVWLATGGKNGARWTEKSVYGALEGRTVILYPDLGAFDAWQEKGKILATVCDVSTSRLLEEKAAPEDRAEGFDLADYFVKALQDATEAPTLGVEPVQRKETAFNGQDAQWEKVARLKASYYIARHRMARAALAQREALQWPILTNLNQKMHQK